MEFFNQLPDNPWIFCVLALVSIIGLILAYRSTPQKVLKCTISSNELISSTKSMLDDLSILYKGKTATKLTSTKITFWNNTFPTINGADIVKGDPFIITLKHGEILDISVLKGHNTPNDIDVKLSDNTATISFDYLDRKEGGIIQIIHTGHGDSVDITGRIKGGKIKPSTFIEFLSFERKRAFIGLILASFILLSSEIPVFVDPLSQPVQVTQEFASLAEPYAILMICIILLCFIFVALSLLRLTKNYIPKNCK